MTNSSFWIFIIALGAVLATVGNIQYNRVREIENKEAMAKQALSILSPELHRNQSVLSQRITRTKENRITLEQPFDTTAWQTVSNSELLLGLGNGQLPQLMQAYYLMNRANSLHSKIIEMSIGLSSALHGSEKTRSMLINNLNSILEELQPILEKVIRKSAIYLHAR